MSRPRLAWFSPMPPVRSGIAGRSAALVADLRRDFDVDVFASPVPPNLRSSDGGGSPHDFVSRHHVRPYDLCIYQFGNSPHHDFVWPYALRYPGLVVLHETRLHHARAAALLREGRSADYRAELAWNEPGINPDLAELAIAGFDSRLYYDWPMVRTLVASARLTAVHGEGAAAELLARLNGRGATEPVQPDRIAAIHLGDGVAFTPAQRTAARQRIRAGYGIPEEAVLFGCFGGLTPEKRVPQILQALPAVLAAVPGARLLLAGAAPPYYDVAADIAARGAGAAVTLTGYLDSEESLTDHMAACDVGLSLRWPTVRETSAPWIRAIALGLPTVTTRLMHTADVPAMRDAGREVRGPRREARGAEPVTIAIDVADEERDLPAAMRSLASDAALRERLGRAAHAWWSREHTFERMAADYRRVIADAIARPAPDVTLPPHMRANYQGLLRELVAPFGTDVTEWIRGI